jgi:hypothetical protein
VIYIFVLTSTFHILNKECVLLLKLGWMSFESSDVRIGREGIPP